MAELIGIVGDTGSGKSTSIRTLNPKTTCIINVAKKPLPIRGFKKSYTPLKLNPETKKYEGNLFNSSDVGKINKVLSIINSTRPEITTIVIEDAQYIMAFETMARSAEKGYEKFTQIATNFYSVLETALSLRDNIKVCVVSHSDNVGDALNPKYKMKTIGKLFCL